MKKLSLAIGVSLLLASQFGFAAKVAVLNLQAAIFSTASAQKSFNELQSRSDYAQWVAQEEALLADLRKLNEDAEKNRMTWSAEQTAEHRKKMGVLQTDREFNMKKIQAENNAVRMAVQQDLLPKAEVAVKQVVESEGIEVVLDQQAVVWAMPTVDITKKVAEAMDKQK